MTSCKNFLKQNLNHIFACKKLFIESNLSTTVSTSEKKNSAKSLLEHGELQQFFYLFFYKSVSLKQKILEDFLFYRADSAFLKYSYFLFLILSFFIFSCSKDVSKYANVKIYDDGKSFAFIISDELSRKVKNSAIDSNNLKMTKKETKILEIILKNKNLCLISSKPSYMITAKQEKIYDITYAKMIEENYNAKPITPITYFGKCNSSK